MSLFNKKNVRNQCRQARLSLSAAFRQQAHLNILQGVQFIVAIEAIQNVGLYCADEQEVDTSLIQNWCQQHGVNVYWPVVQQQSLVFYAYDAAHLTTNRFAIPEPDPAVCESIDLLQLDCILVPCVAFDALAYRLGRGGGFYDRYLAPVLQQPKARPQLLGLAYACQKVPSCHPQAHDVRLDAIITEQGCYP